MVDGSSQGVVLLLNLERANKQTNVEYQLNIRERGCSDYCGGWSAEGLGELGGLKCGGADDLGASMLVCGGASRLVGGRGFLVELVVGELEGHLEESVRADLKVLQLLPFGGGGDKNLQVHSVRVGIEALSSFLYSFDHHGAQLKRTEKIKEKV